MIHVTTAANKIIQSGWLHDEPIYNCHWRPKWTGSTMFVSQGLPPKAVICEVDGYTNLINNAALCI